MDEARVIAAYVEQVSTGVAGALQRWADLTGQTPELLTD